MTYSAASTRSCLEAHGATVDQAGADYIAGGALGGGYEVTIAGKILNLSFGKDSAEGRDLLQQYELFPGGGSGGVYRKGNAVLVWDDDPGADRRTVDGCLTN